MSNTVESSGTGIASELAAGTLSRRSTLKGLAGVGLLGLVGVSGATGTVGATATSVPLVQSTTSSTITGMGTGPLPATLAYLTGSPTFSAGSYDAYVSQIASFYGQPGTFGAGSTWIWGSPDGQSVHDEPAAELLRIEESLELSNLAGTFTLEFAADNIIAAYVNGTLVGTNDNWGSPQKVTLNNLVSGSNTIEIRGMNAGHDGDGDGVEDDPNPAAVRYELVGPEQPSIVAIDIDVKPGSETNPINPSAKGVIPVAIYSTGSFDARTLDASSLRFGPGGAEPAHGGHSEDVDGDGLDDLVVHFPTDAAGFTGSETQVELTGQTADGTPVVGTDSVTMVGGIGSGYVSGNSNGSGNGRGNGRGR